jgi:hypothetical protein
MFYITLFFVTILIFVVSSILVHCPYYESYKLSYNALVNEELVFNYSHGGLVCFSYPKEVGTISFTSEEIIYLRGSRDIKLLGGGYIFSYIPTYFDPYSWYWKNKFHKWFAENESKFVNK